MKQTSSLLEEHYNQFINIYDKMDLHLYIWKPSLKTEVTSNTQQNSETSIKLKKKTLRYINYQVRFNHIFVLKDFLS